MIREPLSIQSLDPSHVSEVIDLHSLTRNSMPPGVVAHDPDAMIAARLGQDGRGGGVFVEGRLVAYALLYLPQDPTRSLARHLEVTGAMAELDGVGVHPDWRGRGLHQELNNWRIREAGAVGADHVFATVSPENTPSLRNLLSSGLHARRWIALPGAGNRLIMHRPLAGWGSMRAVRSVDLLESGVLKAAFAAGAHGIGLTPDGLSLTDPMPGVA